MNAPCDIMREAIYRNFRDELNKTIGQSFIFQKTDPVTLMEDVCLREDEFKTYSKLYCIEKTDKRTMMTLLTVVIIEDKERGRALIPEIDIESRDNNDKKELEEMQKLLDK